MTVIVAEKEEHLSSEIFNQLCIDINPNSAGKITKPRIGDIFRIKGTAQDPYDHHGIKVK